MKTSESCAYSICELPRRFKIPCSVPRSFRVPDRLGFGSFSALLGLRDWHEVNDLEVVSSCLLWQQLTGCVTFCGPGESVTLAPGETCLLLPGEYEAQFPAPYPAALVSVVPDEPLRRAVREAPIAHSMLQLQYPVGHRLVRLRRSGYHRDPIPGAHVGNVVRNLLEIPIDQGLLRALASGPCRALRDEEPREIEEPQDPAGARRFPGSKTLAHFEIEPPRSRRGKG